MNNKNNSKTKKIDKYIRILLSKLGKSDLKIQLIGYIKPYFFM